MSMIRKYLKKDVDDELRANLDELGITKYNNGISKNSRRNW